MALHVAAACDRLVGGQVEPADKHRQPARHDAFGLGHQRMRPIHRGAKHLLAAHHGACTLGQQPAAVMQAVDDLDQRQDAHPRRRQLDRQRHPVEVVALDREAARAAISAAAGWFTALLRETDDIERPAAGINWTVAAVKLATWNRPVVTM